MSMNDRFSSLYWACYRGDKHRVLKLVNPDNVNYVSSITGDTPLHQACKRGWLYIVTVLIEIYGCNPHVTNVYHKSPLDYAEQCGKIDVVSYLQRTKSSLYWACFQGNNHLVLKLINPDNVTYVHPDLGDTPLHQACKQGWLDIVKLLIKKYGCDPNVTNKRHESVLHNACQCGHIDIVKYLIDKQYSNPLLRDNVDQLEPLDCALNNNQTAIAVYLCQHCISSDEMLNPNRIKTTINLIKYILRSSPNDLKWKSATGDNIVKLGGNSKTFISHIPSAVVLEILNSRNAKYFIVKPDCETSDGDTLLQLVCQSKATLSQISSTVLTKWLSDSTATLDLMKVIVAPDLKTADGVTLFQLILCQSEKCLMQISSTVFLKWLRKIPLKFVSKSIPDCKTADGDTLLQLILHSEMPISQTSSMVLSKLLSDSRDLPINQMKMVDPNWKTLDGIHFLKVFFQSKAEDIKVIELMQHYVSKGGFNPDDFLDNEGNTALHIACQANKLAVVSYLIDQAHCDPKIKNKTGSLPLQLTSESEIMEVLINHGAKMTKDVVFKLISSKHLLTDSGTIKLFTLSVRKGAMLWKSNDINSEGNTALHVACQANELAVVSCLINQAHCDPNIRNKTGSMPLQLTSDSRITKILVDHGAKMTKNVVFQLLSSKHITNSGVIELFTLSEKKGTMLWNPNDLNDDGYTALHLACQANKLPVVSYLIDQAHCDPNIKNKTGSFPLQLTSDSGIMKILVDHGAKMTKNVAFQLISSKHITNSGVIELFTLSERKGTLLWNPNDLNDDGCTSLHLACQANNLSVVSYLIDQAHCDPNMENKSGSLPLDMTTNPEVINYLCQHNHVAIYSKTIVKWMNNLISIDDYSEVMTLLGTILKSLADNHRYKTKDGSTLLHVVCTYNTDIFPAKIRLQLVDFLLTKCQCDPNCLDSKRLRPLQLTSDSEIMKTLIEHGAKMTKDVVFKLISSKHITESRAKQLFTLSVGKETMIWNPNDLNNGGCTALQLACELDKADIINFLLAKGKCDPNKVTAGILKSPLELTTNPEIAKKLIIHGAKVTPKLVLKFEAKEANIENKAALIKLMLTTWNPDDRESNGYTALHLACKADNPTAVNLLLSIAHCDPNIKNNYNEVPLKMTTNTKIIKDLIRHGAKTSIMYDPYQGSLGTNKPVQPPVKVFIVGNPSVGKSTLTAALKKKIGIIARIFSGKVSGVDQKTVGIVPHDLESEIFGRITLYDFAGHREFYSGHAALLQTAIQSTPPIFLLVVDLREEHDEVIRNILYWISFLENQCASVSCKPHVILVGSHADTLRGVNRPKEKVIKITDSFDTKCFTYMEYIGFVAMNCRYHKSAGMNDLRRLLIKSCEELRIQEPITFNAHCFLVFLIEKFINLTAVTIKTISEEIKNQQSKDSEDILEFLPKCIETLYKICLELNNRGHILLLKDRIAAENSYIVIDKEFLLSKISGTVFAPEGFKQYQQLSTNTGVVPLSKIKECFPDKDLDILIGFLTHLEFCHEISDEALHELISEQYSHISGEHYYLFPGLISVQADDTVWQMESEYEHTFGWVLKCNYLDQFFSSRFLQVLLLRLAFSFALETSCNDPNQSIGIHRNCFIWKNGIFWGNVIGMQTLVEVTSDNKSVVLLVRFRKANLLRCVHHRSKVISTILQCKEQFCPRVHVAESFVHSSSPLHYPLNHTENLNICSLQDLATAVVTDCECPSVVFQCSTIPVEDFLSFEPYLELKLSIIQELWNEKQASKVISERFLSDIVKQGSEKLILFIKVIIESKARSPEGNQLYQDLLKWRDSDMENQKTYCHLRQLVDQYSVFAGRNLLKLAKQECLQSSKLNDQEYYKRKVPTLIVQGSRPEIYELQMLEFSDGKVLRIMESVAPQWKQVAVALGFSVARIKSIEKGEHYKPDDASFEIFSCWLEGEHDLKPPTWDVLIQCLKQANLLDIAEMLSNLQIIKEDDNESLTARNRTNSEGVSVTATNQDCDVLQRDHGGSLPNLDMKALEVTEGRGGRRVRVIESIGSQWEEVAKALDIGQEDIDMIKTRHSDNDEEACREMLATWLQGNNGEASWTAFSQALIDAGLPELADSLTDVLKLVL